MMAKDVAEAAVEARRHIVTQRRRGATSLAMFILCLVHVQPYSEGAYTSEQLALRLLGGFLAVWVGFHGAQGVYMSTSKKAIEQRLKTAMEEIAMQNNTDSGSSERISR